MAAHVSGGEAARLSAPGVRWTLGGELGGRTAGRSVRSPSAPLRHQHVAGADRAVEEQPHDQAVDEAAALSGLRGLEVAAGAAPLCAGGEDGGALVGR